jgi:hypothetical protein
MANDWEKQQAAAEAARQKRLNDPNSLLNSVASNPLYNTNPYDPNSAIPTVPRLATNPSVGNALPTGINVDPRILTDASIARASQTQEYLQDPKKYIEDNGTQLVNEQSLLDKGKSMMGRVFEYKDESDLHFFGMNVSAVESIWDGFLSHFTGAYDLLNIGFGGLLSAAPGGVRTLSFDELSGGKGVGEVLSGEMVPGSAPSPGQIAIASVGIEAKRIREGGARLSDVLLLNPATAPFILAGIAADSSPIQEDNFDITNKEQRDKAFGSGWEQWMSGITDFGLAFADPLIVAGAGAKMVRNGALGLAGSGRTMLMTEQASKGALEELALHQGLDSTHYLQEGIDTVAQIPTQDLAAKTTLDADVLAPLPPRPPDSKVVQGIIDGSTEAPLPRYTLAENTIKGELPKDSSPFARFIHDVTKTDEAGNKVLSVDDLLARRELKAFSRTPELVEILYKNKSPLIAKLIIDKAMGSERASMALEKLSPATADLVLRARSAQLRQLALYEPAKLKEAVGAAERTAESMEQAVSVLDETINKLNPVTDATKLMGYYALRDQYRQTILDSRELIDIVKTGRTVDPLDPTKVGYNSEKSASVVADILNQDDVIARSLRDEIKDAGIEARMFVPTKNNAYSRMVAGSRERAATAAGQFAREGTSIFPHKRIVSAERVLDEAGNLLKLVPSTTVRTGWFEASKQFENVGRFKRNARVWRYLGEEVPSGFIGWKGLQSIGSDREMRATLNLEMYKGAPVEVTTTKTIKDETGKLSTVTETKEVGGFPRRDELLKQWLSALNDPLVDPQKALMDIEQAIQDDFTKIYGLDEKQMGLAMQKANKDRSAILDVIKEHGYFVDPIDGTIHIVPYLTSQLANGSYMHNWQALESRLNTRARNLPKGVSRGIENATDFGVNMYDMFNDVWRPLTLLRLSYTQRNVFEGMIRAMAYSASLAPMSWPARASFNGIRNKVVARAVDKHITKAASLVDETMYAGLRREFNNSLVNEQNVRSALHLDSPMAGMETGWYEWVKKPNEEGFFEKIDDAMYEKKLEEATSRTMAARDAMKANLDVYEKSIEGTAFGTWRKKQIEDLQANIIKHDTMLDQIKSLGKGEDPVGVDIFNKYGEDMREIHLLGDQLENELHNVMYDPQIGMATYRNQAARQKRIGSGMTVGPDGNYYNDAFAGPMEQIARGNLSADNTIKQSLSLQANVLGSLFREQSIKLNRAVTWDATNPDQWIGGMIDVIETASSNPLVQELVRNGWDVEKGLQWALLPENKKWLNSLTQLQGLSPLNIEKIKAGRKKLLEDDAISEVGTFAENTVGFKFKGKKGENRISKVASVDELPTGGREAVVTDRNALLAHVQDVIRITRAQMQTHTGDPTFMNLLQERVTQKSGASYKIGKSKTAREAKDSITGGDSQGVTGANIGSAIDPKTVSAAIAQMPDTARAKLGFVQGSEVIDMGTPKYLARWGTLANWMFERIGTIPEDAVTRGPFYNERFKAARNSMIEVWMYNNGLADKVGKGPIKNSVGKVEGGTIAHDAFKIPAKELSRIEVQAHARALQDTREWLYTIERRTNVGKYGEALSPFISAQQNTMVVAGKLLYKEPWLAPFIADLWRAPSRLGFEDEDGNLHIPMPLPWVRDFLKDHPEIPFIGGVIDSNDEIVIPKNGLNVFLPESGFGIAPRPTPWIQVAASELMKAGAFPMETPGILVNVLGQEQADGVYKTLKDYVFGEGEGLSAKPLSWDKVLPAYMQKAVYSRDAMSQQYGSTFALQWHTQTARYQAGERDDKPTVEEIHKRTTNSFWFNILGNLGVPTPLTPYPVLTRPVQQSPVQLLADRYRLYQQADPKMANYNFAKDYGDWALQMANTKITKNVGGADPTTAAVTDAKTFDSVIRAAIPAIGDQKDVLGIIVNNRSDQTGYEQSAYEWQNAMNISGSGDTWRQIMSPEEALAERQRTAGWTAYRAFMDQLDAKLASAGLPNYDVSAAAPYKAAKDQFIRNMSQNQDYGGWWTDYSGGAAKRTDAAVRVLELATSDNTFRTEMAKSNKTNLLNAMDQYVYYRRILREELDNRGTTLANKDNADLSYAWNSIRQRLKTSDPRMAEIINTYLSGDENPSYVGVYSVQGSVEGVMQ